MKAEVEEMDSKSRCSVVPPGFRFHPTDEELVDFYLRKKLEEPAKFELNHIIREVDLNKHEPWDLRDKCNLDASHPATEWYFFSHKDKKYPTGTRTNRATKAGFWKATGRDKVILSAQSRARHLCTATRRIGMRKTLVFYRGRAPRGMKSDWIMHEYRLQDGECNNDSLSKDNTEGGWVVCRVFKKKNYEEKNSRTQTSSYNHSNSNLSDEEASPMKSNHSVNISKTDAVSSHSVVSTFKSSQKSLEIKEGEVINDPSSPAKKINLPVFSCKQEMLGDPFYEGFNYNYQPAYSIYQLPYLESAEINALNCYAHDNTVLATAPIISASTKTEFGENQTETFNDMSCIQNLRQPSARMDEYDAAQHKFSGSIFPQQSSQRILLNEDEPGYLIEESIQDSLAKLQGSADQTMAASIANDQLFPLFDGAHFIKLQQPLDTYSSSFDLDLWNFTR